MIQLPIRRTVSLLCLLSSAAALSPALGRAQGSALGQLNKFAAAQGFEAPGAASFRAAPVIEQDEVLAILESDASVYFWFAHDAKLASEALQKGFPAHREKTRHIDEVMGAIGSGWVVLRDPVKQVPAYSFLHPESGKVFFVEVPTSVDSPDGALPKADFFVESDRLGIVYGGSKAGFMIRQRFSLDPEAPLTTCDTRDYADGVVKGASAFDAPALEVVLQEPSLKGVKEALAKADEDGKSSPLKRMKEFLAGKGERAVHLSVLLSGSLHFKLSQDGRDTTYVFLQGGFVREMPIR